MLPFSLLAAAPPIAEGQGIPSHSAKLLNLGLHPPASPALGAPFHGVGRFRDPHTGICWCLLSNALTPAGPARWVASTSREDSCVQAETERGPQGLAIQRGDRVVVEEHTRAVDAFLEAVAMGPAAVGASLDLRLKIGGRVVRAAAIAPGRAALLPATEVRR